MAGIYSRIGAETDGIPVHLFTSQFILFSEDELTIQQVVDGLNSALVKNLDSCELTDVFNIGAVIDGLSTVETRLQYILKLIAGSMLKASRTVAISETKFRDVLRI